jgi:DNA polymerase III alpha subunit
MVGTINRFRSRSALREVAKAYGLPKNEINGMCNAIPCAIGANCLAARVTISHHTMSWKPNIARRFIKMFSGML